MNLDDDHTPILQQLHHRITTLPVETRAMLLDDLTRIYAGIDQLNNSIVDITESVDISVGDHREFIRVPLSILSSQPGSMLWRAVELHLAERPDKMLRFPTACGEYFQFILDILANKDTWHKLKTRSKLFHLMTQLDYFNITGTVSLIKAHADGKQEETRQQKEHQRKLHCIRLATAFLPVSVLFRKIALTSSNWMGVYGTSLYRYVVDMVDHNYQELDQLVVSEVIHDLHILTVGDEASSLPVPWPELSLNVSITWLETLRPCQYTVMRLATQIRADYPIVKVSLYVHVNKIYIRIQPRNGIELEQSFRRCCREHRFERLETTDYYVHTTTCATTGQ
jgi:hypothetical protein